MSDGQSSCDEELSELIGDDGLYSDHSNSDIIPFSENEYEKITVDTDCQTDAADENEDRFDQGQVSPGGASASSKGSGCSSGMDPAIDSALGRSVSDHSIDNNIQQQIAAAAAQSKSLKITPDQVKSAVNKVVSFAGEGEGAMRVVGGRPKPPRDKNKVRMVTKGDHDIGYSSESHSNDEPDFGCHPLEEMGELEEVSAGDSTTEAAGLDIPREGSPDESIERPRSLDTVILRRKNGDGSSEENPCDSGTVPSPVTPDKSWRHSMTSAYDTSSQCSEVNSPFDLDATLETSADTSTCTAVDRGEADLESYSSIQDLISAGSQSFYVMTSVESDADTAAQPPALNITTGEDPEREGEEEEENNVHSLTGFMRGLEQSTPVKGRDGHSSDSDSDLGKRHKTQQNLYSQEVVQSGPRGLGIVCELEELPQKERSESLDVQVDSEASSREAMLSADDLNRPIENLTAEKSAPALRSNESLKKLIQQAELMVREGDLAPPATKFRRRRKGRSKRHHVPVAPVDSTDTSAMPTEDSHISSCDASSECTDSEGEYSSTGSSEDEGANSSIILNKNSPNKSSKSVGAGPQQVKSNTLPRMTKSGKRREHNCSVTEMYELSNRLDLSPFSISESAIDNLSSKNTHTTGSSPSSPHKLRRTTSETSSLTASSKRFDGPYRAKKRKLRRSTSDDTEDKTLSGSSLNQSQRGCLSLPTSRQQSSQEWQSQSQSLSSPDKSPSGETLHRDWVNAAVKQRSELRSAPVARRGLVTTTECSESDAAGMRRSKFTLWLIS